MSEPLQNSNSDATDNRTVRLLNRRLLLATIAVAVIVAPVLYALHRYQQRRNADSLLERATVLEAEQKWGEAADYVGRYVNLFPNDAEARVRLAKDFAQSANSETRQRRAVELYYTAAGLADPKSRIECLRGALPLLLELRRYEEVVDKAALVLAESPQDLPALRARGIAIFNGHINGTLAASHANRGQMFERIRDAWASQPGDVELAGIMANIYHDHRELVLAYVAAQARQVQANPGHEVRLLEDFDGPTEAAQVMDQLIAAAPSDPRAYASRHLYRVKYSLAGAEDDVVKAQELGPDDMPVQALAAQYFMKKGKQLAAESETGELTPTAAEALDRAESIYRHILDEVEGGIEFAYVGMGDVQAVKHEADKAVETWEQGLQKLRGQSLPLNLRLTESFTDRGDVERAVKQMRALREQLAKRPSINKASRRESPDQLIDLLQAQISVHAGDLDGAQQTLRDVAVQSRLNASEKGRAQRAWFALGDAWGKQGAWDQAASAFVEAMRMQPETTGPRIGAAIAWHHAQRLDLAIPYYREVDQQLNSFDVSLSLAQALLEKNTALPAEQRDWNEVQAALDRTRAIGELLAKDPKATPPTAPWRTEFVAAGLIAAGAETIDIPPAERFQLACASLTPLEQKYANEGELFAELAIRYAQWNDGAAAQRAADRYRELVSGDIRWAIVQADLDATRGKSAEARALIDQFRGQGANRSLQVRLIRVLVGVCVLDRDTPGVQAALNELRLLEPWNLQYPIQLAELAMQRGDYAEVARLQNELSAAGKGGQVYAKYCECLALLSQITGSYDPRLPQAESLQRELEHDRPSWSVTYSLQGRLNEIQGFPSRAAEAYRTARGYGERRPWALERSLNLSLRLKNYDEADTILQRIQSQGPLQSGPEVPPFALGAEHRAQLLEMARRAVQRLPDDMHARIWYGHLLLNVAQSDKINAEERKAALDQFQLALAIGPQDASAWNGLFTYYVACRELTEARRTLESMVERCPLEPAQRAFILAQGYLAVGDATAAERQLAEASSLAPEDNLIRLQQARLYGLSKPEQAKSILQEVLRREPNSVEGRHAMAALLMASGKDADLEQALGMLSRDARPSVMPSAELRMRAALLWQRKTGVIAARAEARTLLEALLARNGEATASDRALLAQICESLLDVNAAILHFKEAIDIDGASPELIALCTERLLHFDQIDDALDGVRQLEKLEPDVKRTVGLRALWLKDNKQSDEAAAAVKAFAESHWNEQAPPAEQSLHCQTAAALFDSIGLREQAEPWLRRAVAIDPSVQRALALNLAFQGKSDEALRLALGVAEKTGAANDAVGLASVWIAAGKPASSKTPVTAALQRALVAHPRDPSLLMAVANVDVVTGDTAAAVAKYDRLLELLPQEATVMNNLATLLTENPSRHAEALRLVGQVRDRRGDSAELLDTEGQILLAQNDLKGAISRLEKATSAAPRDSRLRIHLAAAYQAAQDPQKVSETLAKVSLATLDQELLTEKDRELLTQFAANIPQ